MLGGHAWIRTSPHHRPCNEKRPVPGQWHWPTNQPVIRLESLGLFLSRWAFAFRRRGLFFRLGSGSAVGFFGCAFFGCALMGSRLRSWFASRVRFRSRMRLLCFWCAFLGSLGSTCSRSTLFRCALMGSRLGSWFAGRVRFRGWVSLLGARGILPRSSLTRSRFARCP
jgi:hypothetical protein